MSEVYHKVLCRVPFGTLCKKNLEKNSEKKVELKRHVVGVNVSLMCLF